MTVSFRGAGPSGSPVPRLPFGAEPGPVAGAVVIAGLMLAVLSLTHPWWVSALSLGLWSAVIVVPVGQRTAYRWLRDWIAYRVGRKALARELARPQSPADVQVAAGVCGIRTGDTTLVAMIQLAPNLDLPTVIGAGTTYTEDTVPVALLAGMLDQFGVVIDIDIVTTGQRVRSVGSYGMLYDQLIGTDPAVGDRLTWLVLRLDIERNLEPLTRRGSAAAAAPKALASAAHRIAARLREIEIAAHALPAEAMRAATRLLHNGFELSDLQENWTMLAGPVPTRHVTSYEIDLARIDDALDSCWTWHTGRTTLTVALTSRLDGRADTGATDDHEVEVRAFARYVGPGPDVGKPGYLHPLTGRQGAALLASLPVGGRARLDRIGRPRRVDQLVWQPGSELTAAAALQRMPIGPSGQILGVIRGRAEHNLALPLYDPVRYNPRRRTIDLHAQLPVAQQIVLRTVAVGADVEIHTSRPGQWQHLVGAVGDPRSLRLAGGHAPIGTPDRVESGRVAATVAVFDHLVPDTTAAPTTIVISAPGGPRQRSADLAIDQTGETTVDVSIPMHTVRIDLIEPIGEERFLAGTDESAGILSHDRQVPVPELAGAWPATGSK
ncbi:type VII secretion protein EccE [Nocardia mangyaensis]|uniref:type VII secretion protein EccE n=1 Tax=Nocardia mangyaensis TaxID=2213200 RepID=UPI0026774188|nr:type VII secretion protein EccE [Nocardia mangyaensis]MDO3648198.1 type VII secretion protein EccE [Nocardia mangyaensis]